MTDPEGTPQDAGFGSESSTSGVAGANEESWEDAAHRVAVAGEVISCDRWDRA